LRDSSLKKIFLPFLFVLLLNTFVNIFVTKPNLFDIIELRKLSRELDRKIKQRLEENARLRALYKEIKENPQEVKERFVREYLFKLKEGEKVYLLK